MNIVKLLVTGILLTWWVGGSAHANLLNNPGFEEEGTQVGTARHWKLDDPDDHGDAWGNAIRVDWRSKEGRYVGAVRGAWAGMGEYGGFWQETAAEAGATYRASAWLWADGNWTADVQELKVEFWNADRTEQLGAESVTLHDVGEIWVQKEVEGTAPEGTAWVRIVVNVSGVGENGALQIDTLSLEKAP